MEPFELVSDGHRLRAFLLPPRGKALLVFCHGFPGRHFNDALALALNARGYGALLFRYTGAHGSEGEYSFRGNEQDILVAIAAARPRATHGLGVLGWSMGGFHAVRVLARNPGLADFLVLEAPLADAGELRRLAGAAWEAFLQDGQDVLRGDPAVRIAEAAQLPPEEEPVALAPRIKMPALILHGTRDSVVPIEQGRELRDALNGPTQLVELDAGHWFDGLDEELAERIDTWVGGLR